MSPQHAPKTHTRGQSSGRNYRRTPGVGRAEAPGGSYLASDQPGSPRALKRLFLPHQVFPITAG